MAISQNFPNISPSLNLNFARSKYLDPRITFTRSSSATYTDGTGLIKVASADQPRFDHSYNATTGSVKSLGLLIEEQRSNLFTYSEQFDNAAWISGYGQNAVVTANNTTAPDGTTTADLITFTPDGTTQSRKEQIIGTQSGTLTASIFVKKGTLDTIYLYVSTATYPTYPNIGYTFSTDTIVGTNATGTRTFYPNGWVRITATATVTSHTMYTGLLATSSGTLYAWGAQVEQGSFATSYIPTTSATATRSADNASITGSNFNSWYNQNEGTTVVECENVGTKSSVFQVPIGYRSVVSSSATTIEVFQQNGEFAYLVRRFFPDGDSAYIPVDLTSKINSYIKYSFAYKESDFAYSIDNNLYTDTTDSVPTGIVCAAIGSNNFSYINGHIKNILYYPKRLTNSQLQNLTK